MPTAVLIDAAYARTAGLLGDRRGGVGSPTSGRCGASAEGEGEHGGTRMRTSRHQFSAPRRLDYRRRLREPSRRNPTSVGRDGRVQKEPVSWLSWRGDPPREGIENSSGAIDERRIEECSAVRRPCDSTEVSSAENRSPSGLRCRRNASAKASPRTPGPSALRSQSRRCRRPGCP